jgi:aquaporin NIP
VTGSVLRRGLAEFGGTAILVAIGTGAIVGSARVGGIPLWTMTLAWFLAVMIPIVAFVGTSGAHLNPVVSLALAVSGRIGYHEVPPYIASQVAGAFVGSSIVWTFLGNGASLGATVPQSGLVWVVLGESLFTALLIGAVFALSDLGEGRHRLRLLLPGFAVAASTFFIGPVSGSSINPARSLAPAVLSGNFTDLWVYLVVQALTATTIAMLWKPRAVDRLERGPGRIEGSE